MMPDVNAVQRLDPVYGRKQFLVSVSGDHDLRPEIFRLAAKEGWVLWELHEEVGRLEDVFRALTAETLPERE
jgi:hypothetical protein